MRYQLLTPGESNPKVAKVHGAETAILHLAPYTTAGVGNVCPESRGCRGPCLYFQGRGHMDAVKAARIRRTRLWAKHPDMFHRLLDADLHKLAARAKRNGVQAWCRLNGTSDLDWTAVYKRHPRIRFWEYSKRVELVQAYLDGLMPDNLRRLVYSRNEKHGDAQALELRQRGAVVVVVWRVRRGQPLPKAWHGFPVRDGDRSDARWRDPAGSIVGVRAKGTAWLDRSGFVVDPP